MVLSFILEDDGNAPHNDFIESFGVEFFIHDVVLTGSLANYNWSQYSDVDLHIIIDFEESKYEMDLLID